MHGDEWPISEVARSAGTTSRTLRHYDRIGLLRPSRIGQNGYRYYDRAGLVRLQRILLLRQLGLGLPAIGQALEAGGEPRRALERHVAWLREEQGRLARQIASVEKTIRSMEGGEWIMEEMFDGFDHTRYRDEVEERWGADAYAKSDAWWRSPTSEEKKQYQQQHRDIARDYESARAENAEAASERVQAIVARHVDWLNVASEATGGRVTPQRLRGYGDMYVADPRFAANYGGPEGASFVRDAFRFYAEHSL